MLLAALFGHLLHLAHLLCHLQRVFAHIGHGLHHLAHIVEAFEDAVDFLIGNSGACSQAATTAFVDTIGVCALEGGHGDDDRLCAVE